MSVSPARYIVAKKTEHHSLSASIVKVKVPELQPDPLARLPDELVVAADVLGVGAGVGGREELLTPVPAAQLVAMDGKVAEAALALHIPLRYSDSCEPC